MDLNILWSLRLGFSGKQAQNIQSLGINKFLNNSFAYTTGNKLPDFLRDVPKTFNDIRAARLLYNSDREKAMLAGAEERRNILKLKGWWIDKMEDSKYPLREKMTLFWHNHFVATAQKVKYSYYVYQHNALLRENAFGNFRELTKQVIRTNAMIGYLDNNKNSKKGFNENLSRELLELFTLGEGNYSEQDIKNGAKGLAGLTYGDERGEYNIKTEYNDTFKYLGKTGNFKAEEMVDIIFEQPAAPYLITRKILKWIIYDNPSNELVKYYGDYLKAKDFEIEPLLRKMFTEEFKKPTAGSKIKDPLTFVLHLMDELHIKKQDHIITANFLKLQGMDIFNQPNVKGWDGGKYWLTAQLFVHRNRMADWLCQGFNHGRKALTAAGLDENGVPEYFKTSITWSKKGKGKDLVAHMQNRLLTFTDTITEQELYSVLPYDFSPKEDGAESGVKRLFNHLVKTPEFQLI